MNSSYFKALFCEGGLHGVHGGVCARGNTRTGLATICLNVAIVTSTSRLCLKVPLSLHVMESVKEYLSLIGTESTDRFEI